MARPARRSTTLVALAVLLSVCAGGCSIKRFAIKRVANALTAGGEVWSSDEDPELIRDAVPFALKTYESLLETVPEHRDLLVATCSGFTQYGYAFVETDAVLIEDEDWRAARRLEERALRLYLRARGYCMRALELQCPGVGARLGREPEAAIEACGTRDVELLYWTGAAWGASIALGKDRPEIVADLPVVRSLLDRALALDETHGDGAIHDLLIVLESLGENYGGSVEGAREHFRRAVELSDGRRAGTFVALATSVSVPAQDRAEFERLIGRALQVDPDADPPNRLANLIVQRRARHLLDVADELFFDPGPGPDDSGGRADP